MLIDGKSVAAEKNKAIASRAAEIAESTGKIPMLRLVSVGSDQASESYIKSKMRYGEKVGVRVEHTSIGKETQQAEIRRTLESFSRDPDTNGIILEAPLPAGMNHVDMGQSVDPMKDVDCITAMNQGRIALNREFMLPATAQAIRTLIDLQNLPKGSSVAIINRSPVIGRPLTQMLLNRDYTVTVCHSKTKGLPNITRQADVVVVGVAKAGFLGKDHVRESSIVIDAGINFVEGKMTGDANFSAIGDLVKSITPVPGGVGPVTTACIFENLLTATEAQMKNFVH